MYDDVGRMVIGEVKLVFSDGVDYIIWVEVGEVIFRKF